MKAPNMLHMSLSLGESQGFLFELPTDAEDTPIGSLKYIHELKKRIKTTQEVVKHVTDQARAKQKNYYDHKAKVVKINVGDRVSVRILAFEGRHKIQDRYEQDAREVIGQPKIHIPVFDIMAKDGSIRRLHRNTTAGDAQNPLEHKSGEKEDIESTQKDTEQTSDEKATDSEEEMEATESQEPAEISETFTRAEPSSSHTDSNEETVSEETQAKQVEVNACTGTGLRKDTDDQPSRPSRAKQKPSWMTDYHVGQMSYKLLTHFFFQVF